MDLGEILRVIRHRWYIMVPMMLVTVALTAGVWLVVPIKYQSQSTITLLNARLPATATTPAQNNPFLTFDSSLTAAADLLARSLTSDQSVQQLATQGVTEQYTAALADNAQGPFIALTVTGTNKAHVFASMTTLTGYAEQRLRQIQQQNGVPAAQMIHTAVIIPPQPPQKQLKTRLESLAGAFGAGTVAAFIATFVTEGLALSRRRARPAPPTNHATNGTSGHSLLIVTRATDREPEPANAIEPNGATRTVATATVAGAASVISGSTTIYRSGASGGSDEADQRATGR